MWWWKQLPPPLYSSFRYRTRCVIPLSQLHDLTHSGFLRIRPEEYHHGIWGTVNHDPTFAGLFKLFFKVQQLRSGIRRYPDGWGETHPLSGLLYCADYGSVMYIHRVNNGKRIPQFICANYSKLPVGSRCTTQHPGDAAGHNYEYRDGLTVGNRVYDKLIYEYRK